MLVKSEGYNYIMDAEKAKLGIGETVEHNMKSRTGKHIGLIVPSSNTIMEPDFYRNLPSEWTLHSARMYLEDVTVETEGKMLDEYTLPAARDLATAKPDVVVFGCTSAGALRGNEYEVHLMEKISALTDVPTVSVIHTVRETLKTLGVKQLVVITPYLDELNERIRASLEKEDMKVLHIEGLGIRTNTEIASVHGDDILGLARDAVGDLHPDALFVSCTNFPAVSVLSELREKFPFPVITSNQAVLERTIDIAREVQTL
jgi:maleate isomerase